MNKIACAPKLKNAEHIKLHHVKNAKVTKFLLQSAFYTSKGRTCNVLPFYDFWFKFYGKFCIPYLIVNFLHIFNHKNRKL